ncbi:MAG TPA: helix-turn-helix transcriptional regulator [Nitrospira sp.]
MSHAIGVTKIERFLKANNLKPAHVADFAGISRQHLYRIRLGVAEPTRLTMVWVADACGKLLHRHIGVDELFDLGDGQ